jgi:hypothetical protein
MSHSRHAVRFALAAAVLGFALLLAAGAASAARPAGHPHRDEGQRNPALQQSATLTLYFRWTLTGYLGPDVDILTALAENPSADGDLTEKVSALYAWDSENQKWTAFFTDGVGIPGVNDFTELTTGTAYWIATTSEGTVTWEIPEDAGS